MRMGRQRERRMIAVIALSTRAYGRHRSRARRELAEAADRALKEASEDEWRIYQAEFVQGMDGKRITESCHVSMATYYRIRAKLIDRVADEVG